MNIPQFYTNNDALYADHKVDVVDAWDSQLSELAEISEELHYGAKTTGPIYVYLPWRDAGYRIVRDEYYQVLRTNRNQDLITADEQKLLYRSTVAVFGLSVGSSIALTMAQAGIAKDMLISDFDVLETTNLNRIQLGLPHLMKPKIDSVVERIYEIDPYAQLRLMPDGVTDENSLRDQLLAQKTDLIIEEVDDFPAKIMIRQVARKLQIPIIMVTDNGDGIVIHIDRYDLGHSKIYGKDDSFWKTFFEGELKREDFAALIMESIGGREKVDPKMLASVERVYKGELVSWSQLGSAASLAGVMATYYAKKILLGEETELTRLIHVNPSEL